MKMASKNLPTTCFSNSIWKLLSFYTSTCLRFNWNNFKSGLSVKFAPTAFSRTNYMHAGSSAVGKWTITIFHFYRPSHINQIHLNYLDQIFHSPEAKLLHYLHRRTITCCCVTCLAEYNKCKTSGRNRNTSLRPGNRTLGKLCNEKFSWHDKLGNFRYNGLH